MAKNDSQAYPFRLSPCSLTWNVLVSSDAMRQRCRVRSSIKGTTESAIDFVRFSELSASVHDSKECNSNGNHIYPNRVEAYGLDVGQGPFADMQKAKSL